MLIYTSTFKAYNLKTESSVIRLSECAWIETSDEFVGKPEGALKSLLRFEDTQKDPQYGLSRFIQPLVASPIRFRTIHSEHDANHHPFRVHDCTYIAIAVSIVCDRWFVCGIESLCKSSNPVNPSIGPSFSFFWGEAGPAIISSHNEVEISEVYDFVYKSLTISSWDSEQNWLLFHYLRLVAINSYQRFSVLKIGLEHIFTEWHSFVLNAALFFERMLTEESADRQRGVEQWNITMGFDAQLDTKLIDILFSCRHAVVHSNPTRAKKKLDAWISEQAKDRLSIDREFRNQICSAARRSLRAMILDRERYIQFRNNRPK